VALYDTELKVYTALSTIVGGTTLPLDPRLLEILCCPACRKPVGPLAGEAGLICGGCGRIYPIVDGIPVMLVEEARIEPSA
jgi:uncharacterized protein YbaR (Trm112 family)